MRPGLKRALRVLAFLAAVVLLPFVAVLVFGVGGNLSIALFNGRPVLAGVVAVAALVFIFFVNRRDRGAR